MAFGTVDPSAPKPHTPKLPSTPPAKAIPDKIAGDLGAGDITKPDADANKEVANPPTVPVVDNVQRYSSLEKWSELPSNLFSNVGSSGTGEVSSIARISTDDTDDFGLEVADTGFQILELDEQTAHTHEDEGIDGDELDLEVGLGIAQLDADDRKGAQELASLMGGLEAFRQGQYMKAYQLDPNSFTAYKTIKS